MKCQLKYVLLGVLCVGIIACDKDDNYDSNNFATGIVELPALRNGVNDVFITHSTTFNGQKITSFSMEYDKSKKHSRWIIRPGYRKQPVAMNLSQTLCLAQNTSAYKQTSGEEVMIEGTSVLQPTDSTTKKPTTRLSIIPT